LVPARSAPGSGVGVGVERLGVAVSVAVGGIVGDPVGVAVGGMPMVLVTVAVLLAGFGSKAVDPLDAVFTIVPLVARTVVMIVIVTVEPVPRLKKSARNRPAVDEHVPKGGEMLHETNATSGGSESTTKVPGA
jgi:hypothetical protein